MDMITAEERRAIDEATDAGRVTYVEPEPALEHRGRKPSRAVAERRKAVEDLASQGKTVAQIAEALNVKAHTVYGDVRFLGVEPKRARKPNGSIDKAATRKASVAKKKSVEVRDRRRFKTVPVPMGDPSIMAPKDASGSIFESRVFAPDRDEALLKDGCNQSKIGGDVLLGWLKGARIYTLTLEERATCPRACVHWQSCYGNSMPHARRWKHGPELTAQLGDEIADLCGRHDRVLIRLHVLGDFWSVYYVDFWGKEMERHPNLYVFGFTAHKQGTEIGDYIAATRGMHPDRFWIRHSDMTGEWGTFTVDFPTAQKRIGDAVVCPEQRDGMEGGPRGTHCGNCGVCWSSSVPVAFVTH